MHYFKTGDLIAKRHPKEPSYLQIGIVIDDTCEDFSVKWTWYDKLFFMEKEEEIFKELNKAMLLSIKRVNRSANNQNLVMLNPIYFDEKEVQKRYRTPKKDCS